MSSVGVELPEREGDVIEVPGDFGFNFADFPLPGSMARGRWLVDDDPLRALSPLKLGLALDFELLGVAVCRCAARDASDVDSPGVAKQFLINEGTLMRDI